MKGCIAASSYLVIGFLSSLADAAEKRNSAESTVNDSKKERSAARHPVDRASKLLSEFETDGDSMLNAWELTAMFQGMRDRLQQAKYWQGRAGQGRGIGDRRGPSRTEHSKMRSSLSVILKYPSMATVLSKADYFGCQP